MIKHKKTIDVCNAYLKEKEIKSLKISSISNYYNKINSYIIPILPTKFWKTKEEDVIHLVDSIKKNVSQNTLISYTVLINDFFKFANNKKYTKQIIALPYPRKTKTNIVIFNSEEQEILENYLLKNLNHFNLGILIALRTGIRLGELGALKVKDIDNEKLHVNFAMQRVKNFDDTTSKTKIIISTPKSHASVREIPFDDLYCYFKRLECENEESFISTGNSAYMDPRTIQRRFKEILIACGIKVRKFHALRDTFATNCARAGMDIKVLAEILGHSNTNVTLQYYIYVDFEYKAENMKKLPPLKTRHEIMS